MIFKAGEAVYDEAPVAKHHNACHHHADLRVHNRWGQKDHDQQHRLDTA
jgi:hypothetical protein